MKNTWRNLGNVYFVLAVAMTPNTPAWKIPLIVVGVLWLSWVAYDFVKGDKELAHQRKEELRVKRIRELEKELGYTPLELGDPTAPVKSNQPEKE